MTPSNPDAPAEVGVYVHVPFCARACTYCDFDFTVGRSPDVDGYIAALERDYASHPLRDLARRPVRTVYFGGGTPSALGASGIAALAAWVRARFDLAGICEWTVEVNPEHVDAAFVNALRDAGVDRASVGVQSFNPVALKQMGRAHSPLRAREAIALLTAAGLRTSLDLIVGWPGQTARALAEDVDAALATGVDHVSVYALTIEDGSSWPKLVRRGLRVLPDDDAAAERLLETESLLTGHGFEHYEISSYGRAGARGQHNVAYWSWRDYVGYGPSAASAQYDLDGGVARVQNQRGLSGWQTEHERNIERLSGLEAAAEGLWLGLRQLTGLQVDAFLRRFRAIDRQWVAARVEPLVRKGDLEWTAAGALRVARGRWLFHDAIASALLA